MLIDYKIPKVIKNKLRKTRRLEKKANNKYSAEIEEQNKHIRESVDN